MCANFLFRWPELPRAYTQSERDVFEYGHVPEQRVVLKDEAHVPLARRLIGDVLSIELNASAIGEFETGNDPQQRGLARTRRPQQRDELPIRNFQIDVLERGEMSEIFANAAYADAHRICSVSLADWAANCCAAFHSTMLLTNERREGQQGQQRRHRKCRDELVVVVENFDVQRHGVGESADVAGHHRYGAEFAHGAGVAKNHAVDQRPFHVGQRHAEKCLPAAGAQRQRGFFLVIALRLNHREQLARDKRKRDEDRGQHDSGNGKDDSNAMRDEPRSQQTLHAEKQDVDQSRDDR